jgi:hypothetical protein
MTQPAVRNRIRLNVTEGQKQRYWRPSDGMWTELLAGNASSERYYTRIKGFMMEPPGELAMYVNPETRDNRNADPRTRAEISAKSRMGPLPTGAKGSYLCHGHEGCGTWETHYGRLGMEIDYMMKDAPAQTVRNLTDDDVTAVIKRLESQGLRLVKDGDNADIPEPKADGGDLGKVQVEAGPKNQGGPGQKHR